MKADKIMLVGWILIFAWIPLAFIITAEKAVWFCFLGLGLVVIGYIKGQGEEIQSLNNSKEMTDKRLAELENYNPTQKIYFDKNSSLLSIDENSKKLCIIRYGMPEDIINFKDILQSEIIEDGVSVTKTSRGSQVGGALIGGVLAGGVGALIGGLSGAQETTQEVKKVQLQIIVNDIKKPVKLITFLNETTPKKKSDEIYKIIYKNVNHWQKVFSVIIKQVDDEDKQKERNSLKDTFTSSHNSTADELKKLADLKRDGILSEEEFFQQKQKLLSS